MRAAFPLLLLLGACQQDFDDRYADTEAKIKAAEKQLDAEMAEDAKREPGAQAKDK